MKVEVGCEAGGIRVGLVLKSEDVEAHSKMSAAQEFFQALGDELATFARMRIRQRFEKAAGEVE